MTMKRGTQFLLSTVQMLVAEPSLSTRPVLREIVPVAVAVGVVQIRGTGLAVKLRKRLERHKY